MANIKLPTPITATVNGVKIGDLISIVVDENVNRNGDAFLIGDINNINSVVRLTNIDSANLIKNDMIEVSMGIDVGVGESQTVVAKIMNYKIEDGLMEYLKQYPNNFSVGTLRPDNKMRFLTGENNGK